MIDPKRVKEATWRQRGEVVWWWSFALACCLLIWGLAIQAVMAWL